MNSPKMTTLLIWIYFSLMMFAAIGEFNLSFMESYMILPFIILFIGGVYLPNSWFYYITGVLTGVLVFIPMITNIFFHSQNLIALMFDGLLSLFLLLYYGYKMCKKKGFIIK